MRILFLSDSFYPSIGGIEVMTETLATQFSHMNYEIKIATWTTNNDSRKFNFEVVRNPSIWKLFKLYRWADMVLENNPCMKLSWLNLFMRLPRVVVIQTWINRVDGSISWIDRLKKLWVRQANCIISVSQAIKKSLIEDSFVIENCYRSTVFRKLSDIERTRDFVFLGRLVSDKGVDMCISLLHALNQKNNNFSLTIIGDGKELNSLKQKVNELGLIEAVEFLGFLEGQELVSKLNQHKFLLVPSRWEEPFGIVALEGIACGLIPIVSNNCGLEEAIGNAGISFERNSLYSLISHTEKLMKNIILQEKLKNNATSHLEDYKEELVAKKYLAILQNI